MPNNAAKLLVALPLPLALALPLLGSVVVAPTVPPPLPRPLPLPVPLALAPLALALEGNKIVLVDKLIVKQRIKDLNMQKKYLWTSITQFDVCDALGSVLPSPSPFCEVESFLF